MDKRDYQKVRLGKAVFLALFRDSGWLLARTNSLSAALIGLFLVSAYLYLSLADLALAWFVAARPHALSD